MEEVKLCECGCGLPAPIAKRNDKSRNIIKGQPQRFIRYHYHVAKPYNGETKYCECGCGGLAPIAKYTNKKIGHIRGHPVRFIQGHVAIKRIPLPEKPPLCACGCGKPTKISKYTVKSYGTKKGQYLTYLRGHYKRKTDEIEAFWSKVDKRGEDECWEWESVKSKDGYGIFNINKKTIRAHRFSFVLFGGILTEEKNCVCHTCDNPACVNPKHLFAGSRIDNNMDKIKKGRSNIDNKGEKHGMSKFKKEDIRQIILLKGKLSQRKIAKQFGMSRWTVADVINGKRWKHIYKEMGGQNV